MTSWTLHFLAPIILMSVSALVLATLGVLHLVYTFRGPVLCGQHRNLVVALTASAVRARTSD
jgi:hypothetical protein